MPAPAPFVPPLVPDRPRIPVSGAPPWVDREKPKIEEREDELASELSSPRVVSIGRPSVVAAYQEQAARDMLPAQAGPQPLSIHDERSKARSLAQEIHEKNQQEGLFGKIRKALGFP